MRAAAKIGCSKLDDEISKGAGYQQKIQPTEESANRHVGYVWGTLLSQGGEGGREKQHHAGAQHSGATQRPSARHSLHQTSPAGRGCICRWGSRMVRAISSAS